MIRDLSRRQKWYAVDATIVVALIVVAALWWPLLVLVPVGYVAMDRVIAKYRTGSWLGQPPDVIQTDAEVEA